MNSKGLSLMLRCVVALGLMVGFYVLAIAIAGGLLYIPYAEIQYAHRIHVKLAAFCLITAGAIVWAVLPRVDKFTLPGPKLTSNQHPRLFGELRTIADMMQQAMPIEVYLIPEVNAWVSNRGGVMGFGSRRIMGLGLPLLKVLSVSELRAVLAHEFGHYHGGDTALAPWIYKTRAAIMRTLGSLQDSAIQKPFLWYGKTFLRVTFAVSRQQEYAADAQAARVAGAPAMISGLQKTHRAAHAFASYWRSEVVPVLAAGFHPPIADGFSAFLASDNISRGTVALLAEEFANPKPDLYDTHPSLKDRIEALGGADTKPLGDEANALSLVDDAAALEDQLLLTLFGQQDRGPLRKITWQETLAAVYLPAWTERARDHAEALTGIQLKSLPKLVQDPAQLLARFENSLGAAVSGETSGAIVAAIIGVATAVVLHNRGLPVWCELGCPVSVRCGKTAIHPLSIVTDLAAKTLSQATWLSVCAQHSLGDVDLGVAINQIVKRAQET